MSVTDKTRDRLSHEGDTITSLFSFPGVYRPSLICHIEAFLFLNSPGKKNLESYLLWP